MSRANNQNKEKMKHIRLYTDGACSGNPGRGGWAAVAFDEEGNNIMQHSAGYRHTTNNRMEILAVAEGLNAICKQLREYTRDTDIKVTVCSDSQLVVNTMTLGWSKKSNTDLWDRLDEAVDFWSAEYEIRFEKVKGHSTDKGNNLADEIAVEASRPENATGIDSYYEKINAIQDSLFPARPEDAEIVNIHLLHNDKPESRKIEVSLSDGNIVSIIGCEGGFEQYGALPIQYSKTVHIAMKFLKWLNGGAL